VFVPLTPTQSQPVLTVSDTSVSLQNPGPGDWVNLKVGDTEIPILKAGASQSLNEPVDTAVHGRFSVNTWSQALKNVSESRAEFHLRTAGFFLDVLQPGPEGDPRGAVNLVDLRHLDPAVLDDWAHLSPIAQRLLARAARHTSPAYVLQLMRRIMPNGVDVEARGAYADLESSAESVRIAIETFGHSAVVIQGLRTRPEWANDRGVSDLRVLSLLEDGSIEHSDSAEVTPALIEAAAEAPDQAPFIRMMASVALSPFSGADKNAALLKKACIELGRHANQMSQTGRWLAAEAYLRLVVTQCGDSPQVRDRLGEYYRRRAEESTERQDLVGAVDWMSAAYWVSRNQTEKHFLAETLAELSILRFRAQDSEAGRDFLKRARELDAFNAKVLEAGEYEPQVDPRARLGVGIVIVLLAFFAFRRLRKVWSRQ